MLALAWLIIKATLLLIVMAIGGVMVAFGVTFRFVMGWKPILPPSRGSPGSAGASLALALWRSSTRVLASPRS